MHTIGDGDDKESKRLQCVCVGWEEETGVTEKQEAFVQWGWYSYWWMFLPLKLSFH